MAKKQKVKPFQTKEEDKKDVGPLADRGCTDIICIIIFIVFLAGMVAVAYFAFLLGDPWRIINGYDSFGNTCGRKNDKPSNISSKFSGLDLTSKPYLMYFDPTVMLPSSLSSVAQFGTGNIKELTMMICVEKCPSKNVVGVFSTGGIVDQRFATYKEIFDNEKVSYCQYDFFESYYNDGLIAGKDANKMFIPEATSGSELAKSYGGASGPCPPFLFNSKPLLNRCLPDTEAIKAIADGISSSQEANSTVEEITDKINQLLGTNVTAEQVMKYAMSDVMNSYREVAVMCCASLVISFIMILLLGWIAQIMIYAIALCTAVACIAGPAYFWYVWYKAKEDYDNAPIQVPSQAENVETLMVYAIVVSVVCLVVLLLIIFLRSRVGLMVTIFKEAGFMVMRMIVILFTPILLAVFILAWSALWTFVSGFIYTADNPKELTFTRTYKEGGYDGGIAFVIFEDQAYIKWVWLYHLFGLYWVTEFLLACHEMAIAGAFVQFYWTRDKSKVHFPVVRGIWWVFRYHLGTVAFGSCIIAIIQLIRTILAYIQNKTKDSTSEIVKYLLMCLQCCLWCFEKVMKFINRNAYIYTAFKGSNFCTSCKKVFGLLMSNIVRVGIVNCVGSFILFLGKFLVVLVVLALGYFMMSKDETLYFWAIPVLIACIFAFAVAHTFFSVYEIGIDAIFICFCEDETKNDGTPGREYYMSKNLMQWVDNSSEAIANLRRKKKQQKAQSKSKSKSTSDNVTMEDM